MSTTPAKREPRGFARLDGIYDRLTIVYGGLVLSTVILLLGLSWSYIARDQERRNQRLSMLLARVVASSAQSIVLSGRQRLQEYFDHYVEVNEGVEYVFVIFDEGVSVVSGTLLPNSSLLTPGQARARLERMETAFEVRDLELVGRPIRELAFLFDAGQSGEHSGELRLGLSREDELAAARGILLKIGAGGALISLLALVFLRLASRRLAAPILELSDEFSALLDHAPLGVLIEDQRGIVVRASRKAEELFGADLIEREVSVGQLLDGGSCADWQAEDRKLLTGELPLIHRECTLMVGDESKTFAVTRFTRRDGSGGGDHCCTLLVDISERLELEDRLMSSQRMESLGQFAGGIAHDFNNVIAAILGYADMLHHDAPEGSRIERYSERILQSCERGSSLASRLLAFGRSPELEPENVDLNRLLRGFDAFLRRIIRPDITLTLDLGPTEKLQVLVDVAQIERVLMNLVSNARDALGPGGRILISTRERELSEPELLARLGLERGIYAELCVEDDGVGIDPERLSTIFEPFESSKSEDEGTGLGLTISRSILSRHGGAITASSTPGACTRLTIYLPLATTPSPLPTESPADPEPQQRSREARVLVVEDDDDVRGVVSRGLSNAGFDVLAAVDGEQGLRAVEQAERNGRPIDLVLTDVMMPKLGGVPMAAQLRERFPDLRIVFMTAYDDDALEAVDIPHEAIFVLRKPFRIDELRTCISGALGAR